MGNTGAAAISRLSQLVWLSISWNKQVEWRGMCGFTSSLVKLKHLDAGSNAINSDRIEFGDTGAEAIANSLTLL